MATKIVCINDDFSTVASELIGEGNKLNFPKKGEEYTIRHIFPNDIIGEPSYLLNEIANPHFFIPLLNRYRELAFAHWRFKTIGETFEEEECDEEFDKLMKELEESIPKPIKDNQSMTQIPYFR